MSEPVVLTTEEHDSVYRRAVDMWWEHSEWRRGQALWLALRDIRPEVALTLNGTEADCFYDDSRIPAFWAALGRPGDTRGVVRDSGDGADQ